MLTFALEPATDQIPATRRFVVDAVEQLGGPSGTTARGDIALAASEAITNAVVYGRSQVDIAVERVGADIEVSVHDEAHTDIPTSAEDPGPSFVGGHGLAIICHLATCWGVDSVEDDGKTLWFVISDDQPDAGPPPPTT
jgi:anti-sigma regulatory factor (Ser/Thr protein kinase)